MRRLVILLVVALVGAGAFGLSNASTGLRVSGATVPGSAVRAELATIAATPVIQCYLVQIDPVNYVRGPGTATLAAKGAATWTDLRVEGLAIDQYVSQHFGYHASSADLASAETSLESEMTDAADSNEVTCPGTPAAALAAMPSEMRSAMIESQATSLYLLSKLDSTIALTTANLETYYQSHASDYDTLCVSVALVGMTAVSDFRADEARGMSVAKLAQTFSQDSSAAKGGAYGCFATTSTSYVDVRADVGTTPLDTFPATPLYIEDNGTEYALYVTATKRTPTPFATAESVVLGDVKNQNADSANVVKEQILYDAAVAVDPAFGRWGANKSGPTVFLPAVPAARNVASASTLTAASATSYK